MSRWFRVYDSLVDDPKVQRLAPDTFKALVNLWCLACRNNGDLPSLGDIAFSLRTTVAKVQQLIVELKLVGLIDQDVTTGANHPHNWIGRQFKSDVTDPTNATRQKRYRKRHGVTPPVTGTVTVSTVTPKRPDTEAETEQNNPSLRDGARTPAKRATRLPENYEPDLGDALSLGIPLADAIGEVAKFKDWARSAPGQKGVKQDWPAAWRNWCRRSLTDMGTTNGQRVSHSRKPNTSDALLRAVAEQFAPGPRANGHDANADARLHDQPGAASPDRKQAIDLAEGDYTERA